MKTERRKQKAEMGEHQYMPYCLTLGSGGAGVWQRDKMSRKKLGKFTIRHAVFTILIRLNPSYKSRLIVPNRVIFMTRDGRKQPRRAMASAHPPAKPFGGTIWRSNVYRATRKSALDAVVFDHETPDFSLEPLAFSLSVG